MRRGGKRRECSLDRDSIEPDRECLRTYRIGQYRCRGADSRAYPCCNRTRRAAAVFRESWKTLWNEGAYRFRDAVYCYLPHSRRGDSNSPRCARGTELEIVFELLYGSVWIPKLSHLRARR